MGIQDRDYWQEQYRRAQGGTTPPRPLRSATAVRQKLRSLPPWILWIGLLVGGVVLAKVFREWKRTEPFPPTGQVHWYIASPQGPVARLTLQAPPHNAANFVVKLDTWDGHSPVAMVPIRSGETARVQVPLGRYRMTIHKGLAWQGPSRMFGFSLDVREVAHPVEFYRVGNTITGHRFQLETVGGNVDTRPARQL